MSAWYNEIEPFAAAWLRELIREGHIADGVVDERSIADVAPTELSGFAQCHFFAGIGVWSYALRKAGWPDDRPVWTGSCPCQPFSAAGARAGFDDIRHVWPFWHWLISQCRPAVVLGEQVASVDGLGWLDLVSADLEGTDYAFGAADLCAAGVGAPHIRQRLWFVAQRLEDADARLAQFAARPGPRAGASQGGRPYGQPAGRGDAGRLADAEGHRRPEWHRDAGDGGAGGRAQELDQLADGSGAGGRLADAESVQGGIGIAEGGADGRHARADREHGLADRLADAGSQRREGQPVRLQPGQPRQAGIETAGGGDASRLADARHDEPPGRKQSPADYGRGSGAGLFARGEPPPRSADGRPSPVDGFWRDCDWLRCRDGKWRPVESGTFPLAHGVAARVGRLRGYGNALNAEAARTFIEAVMA